MAFVSSINYAPSIIAGGGSRAIRMTLKLDADLPVLDIKA